MPKDNAIAQFLLKEKQLNQWPRIRTYIEAEAWLRNLVWNIWETSLKNAKGKGH